VVGRQSQALPDLLGSAFQPVHKPGVRSVRAGTLDDPAAVARKVHIFTRSKLPWVTLPDSMPAFKVYYDTKKLWPAASLGRVEGLMASALPATVACLLESEVRMPFEDLIAAWDGEQVIVHFDRPTGSWMFICMHSTTLGPAAGGTRLRAYPSPEDGLADGLRLSEGMTWKAAVGGLPHGGGKGVIAVSQLPQGEVREGLLVRYAQLVNTLGGNFRTGPDMNITQADVDLVAQHTPYIFGRSISAGGSGSSGPDTAIGVLHGIRACVTHVFGEPTLEGRVVLIQGVGGVGEPLAELLVAEGATVIASDPDHERVAALVDRLHVASVSSEEAIGTECDVFSPCAIGGILNADTISRLRCRIVAGSANNQLATPEGAERLRTAGILYAPDYVINVGGGLHLYGLEQLGWDNATLQRHLADIGDTLATIFTIADENTITTLAAAGRIGSERLARASASAPA
jgi:leucine dehydrogenase